MSVHTVFVDVDLTLVDAHGKLRLGVKEALKELRSYGYEIYCWSAGGKQRALKVVYQHDLHVDGCVGKPDILIDDSPVESIFESPRCNVLKADKKGFWLTIWDEIFRKDVSFAEDQNYVP